MFWRKKKIAVWDKSNFAYVAQGRKIIMSNGTLVIDGEVFDKNEYPVTYDLAVCLGFTCHQFKEMVL